VGERGESFTLIETASQRLSEWCRYDFNLSLAPGFGLLPECLSQPETVQAFSALARLEDLPAAAGCLMRLPLV